MKSLLNMLLRACLFFFFIEKMWTEGLEEIGFAIQDGRLSICSFLFGSSLPILMKIMIKYDKKKISETIKKGETL